MFLNFIDPITTRQPSETYLRATIKTLLHLSGVSMVRKSSIFMLQKYTRYDSTSLQRLPLKLPKFNFDNRSLVILCLKRSHYLPSHEKTISYVVVWCWKWFMYQHNDYFLAVVVAQLSEQLLPIAAVRGLNLVTRIIKMDIYTVNNWKDENKEKRGTKRPTL